MFYNAIDIPNLGSFPANSGLIPLERCSDGWHQVGQNGVNFIAATGDRKVEFIAFAKDSLAYVKSALGYPAYYPLHPVELRKPVKAVLMDLDGTSVRSEEFWIWIIQLTTATLLDKPKFELEAADLQERMEAMEREQHQPVEASKPTQAGLPKSVLEDLREIGWNGSTAELAEHYRADRRRFKAWLTWAKKQPAAYAAARFLNGLRSELMPPVEREHNRRSYITGKYAEFIEH